MRLYNHIFENQPDYNLPPEEDKLNDVIAWVKQVKPNKLLDVGCGRGHYLKIFHNRRTLYVAGIEPSSYLCENDLKDLPVQNTDILGAKADKYDALYCMDVLEHLTHEELHDNLVALTKLAPKALIGVANHSDRWENVELHPIQENAEWWMERLQNVYKEITLVKEYERFYVFDCRTS